MEYTTEQLKAIQRVETNILKAFDEVARKLNLTYFICGGTLIGAIRHKGFIPWDDDIDVMMPREDYEIFLEKGAGLLPDKYFIQNFHTDPEFPANFTKIRDNDTTFIETSVRNCDINHGVFIDIFPLDFCPDSKIRREMLLFKNRVLSLRISSAFYLPYRKHSFKWKLAYPCLLLMYPSHRRAMIARERLYRSCKHSGYIANYGGAWGRKEIIPAQWYGEGCLLEFEGLEVSAPAEYDKWLEQVYGDYMKLPPEEKRVPHHYVDVIDLEKSYKEHI